MKMFRCNICGKEVSRRKSVAYRGGRACRTHPEAEAAMHKRIAAEKKKRVDGSKKNHWRRDTPKVNLSKASCFCCGREGTPANVFFSRLAIAMQKAKMENKPIHPFMPDYPEKMRAHLTELYGNGEDVHVCLSYVRPEENSTLIDACHPHGKIALQTIGFAMVCPVCMKKNNFDHYSIEKQINLKQIATLSTIMEPALEQEVKKQLAQDVESGKKQAKMLSVEALRGVPFPECSRRCAFFSYMGVGECESACPEKFVQDGKSVEES